MIKSNNTKGNPYHDESDGKFTSKDSVSIDFFLEEGETFDDIDFFLNSFEQEEPKSVSSNNIDFKGTLNALLTNKINRAKIIDTLNKQLNMLPDNFKNIMLNFFKKTNIPINIKGDKTCFSYKTSYWSNEITSYVLNVKQAEILNEDNYNGHMTGTSIVHESFHAIDLLTNKGNFLTTNKVLSNGLTLHDTLAMDIDGIDKSKMFNELLQEYENERAETFEKVSSGKMAYQKAKELLDLSNKNREEMNAALATVNWKWKKKLFPSYEEYVNEFNATAESFKSKLSPYKDEINLAKNIDAEAKKQFRHKYTAICDICESIDPNNKFSKEVGYGHGSKYWNKDYSNRVIEFFAECAEGEALNKESLKKFERYFPNAVKGFREILNYLEKEK